MTGLLHAALQYASRGRAVFPLWPRRKEPLTRNGVKDASAVPDTIRAWWGRNPDANIGCATGAISGFWSLDVDGEDGEATMRRLEAEYGRLPETIELITGNGRQVFFLFTTPIRNSVRTLGSGLDVRGNGGYTILPPSIHPNGRSYQWSVDGHPDDVGLAAAPDWLLDLVRAPSAGQARPVKEWRRIATEPVAQGARNQTLASLAGHLLRRRVDAGVVLDLMRAWNLARCQPPLPDAEVVRTVESIQSRENQRRERDQAGGTVASIVERMRRHMEGAA